MEIAETGYVTDVWDFTLIELKLTQLVPEKGTLSLTMIINLILYILLDVAHMLLEVSKVSKKASIW